MKPNLFISAILVLLTCIGGAQQPTLPAERAITDTTGRQIAGTVLAITSNTLKFRRTSDGREFEIPIGNLSEADKTWAKGSPNPTKAAPTVPNTPAPLVTVVKKAQHDIIVPLFSSKNSARASGQATIKTGDEIRVLHESDYGTTIEYMDSKVWFPLSKNGAPVTSSNVGTTRLGIEPALLTMMLQKRDPFVAEMAEKIISDDRVQSKVHGGPKYLPIMNIIDGIHVKPIGTPETVSLREEVEKLGVKVRIQSGPTCGLYAGWHMFDYQSRKGNMAPQPFEAFKAVLDKEMAPIRTKFPQADDGSYSDTAMIDGLNELSGGRAKFCWGRTPCNPVPLFVADEIIKNEIRNGRPVLGHVLMIGPSHAVLIIGFKTEDQTTKTTQFEAINSNHKDYTWEKANDIVNGVSMEF